MHRPSLQEWYDSISHRLSSIDSGILMLCLCTVMGSCAQYCQLQKINESLRPPEPAKMQRLPDDAQRLEDEFKS